MGQSHERFHVNLAGPVKSALHEVQTRLLLLVESGPRALADDLSMAGEGRHALTEKLLGSLAASLHDYADEEGI